VFEALTKKIWEYDTQTPSRPSSPQLQREWQVEEVEEVVGAEKVEAEEEEAAGTRDDAIYSTVSEVYQMLICKVEEEVRRELQLLP